MTTMNISELLAVAVSREASDLHLTSNSPPILRIDGELVPLDLPRLKPEEIGRMIAGILNEEQRRTFDQEWELDLSIAQPGAGRFRVNVHRQRGCIEAAFRVVSEKIRTIAELGLPPVVSEFARRGQGFVLVTGPTGSGKSTTLAAMIDQINHERRCMIVTIEDPIEYVFRPHYSVIKQRELGQDTKKFSIALREALRQDPDVIVVGEMRDLETIGTALTAAETGHLVLATIHTPDVTQTVDRIIDVFPPYQQNQVRMQFANTINGIVAQQLLPRADGRGRIVAYEVLVATLAVRKILRSSKTEQLVTTMQTSTELGMVTMDKTLRRLFEAGLISHEVALSKSRMPDTFERV